MCHKTELKKYEFQFIRMDEHTLNQRGRIDDKYRETKKIQNQNKVDRINNRYASLLFFDTNYENLIELYGSKSMLVFSLSIIFDIIFPDIAPKVHPK